MRPVNVGGDGDCFFLAVSHQLYGDPNHHLLIRQAGVQYLSNNPERFIESNTESSWNEYINYMSMQGTWCNALIVQAVADCQNVAIHIIESHENFAGEILIGPHYLAQHPPKTIYLGHLDELHYVSTAAVTCGSDALENQHSTCVHNVRPYKVVQAANWVISNSSLYREEGITLNQNLGTQCIDNCLIDDSNIENKNQLLLQNVNKSSSCNIQTDTNCNEIAWASRTIHF